MSLMCEDAMVQVKYAWNNTEYDATINDKIGTTLIFFPQPMDWSDNGIHTTNSRNLSKRRLHAKIIDLSSCFVNKSAVLYVGLFLF